MGIQIEKQVVGFESKLQGARLGCLFLGLGFHYPYHFLHQLLTKGAGIFWSQGKRTADFVVSYPGRCQAFATPDSGQLFRDLTAWRTSVPRSSMVEAMNV